MLFRARDESADLVGREGPCRRIDELLADLRAGRGGALAIVGEPGIGKTALLQYAISRADARVLAATGLQSEGSLPYAGLGDVLTPLLDLLPALPAAQSQALGSALVLDERTADTSPYAVCLATLSLLTLAADRGPLLVVVDDAAWIDEPSLSALLFSARRIADDPVAILLTARDTGFGDTRDLDLSGVARLPVTGLDVRASGGLLARLRPGHCDPAVIEALWRATGGNPLALGNASGRLTDEQLAGTAALPEPVVADADLDRAFAEQLTPLPDNTRLALVVLALSASEDMHTVVSAMKTLGTAADDLAAADDAGLIRVDGSRLRFRHPLMRAAVQRAAPSADRRRAYSALAEATTGSARAWYRAADLIGPDDEAADDLEHAAGRMRAQTGFAAAAGAMRRASDLTSDPTSRARRLLAAAGDACLAGRPHDAAAWLIQARQVTTDPVQLADIELARGRVLNRLGTPAIAEQLMVGAADDIAAVDPRRASVLLREATYPSFTEGRMRPAVRYARRAVALAAAAADADLLAHANTILAETLLMVGRAADSRRLLAAHRTHILGLDPVRHAEELAMIGLCWIWLERYDDAHAVLDRIVDASRRAGDLGALSRALVFRTEIHRSLGDWHTGYAEAAEALRLSVEVREVSTVGFAQVSLARYDAPRGDTPLVEARLDEAQRVGGPLGTAALAVFEGSARGQLHLALGSPHEAVMHLETVRDFTTRAGIDCATITSWEFDLVEAYRLAGRPDDAGAQLGRLTARLRDPALVMPRATAARQHALLATRPADAEQYFREALALHERRPDPFEHARTRLAFGAVLRRQRRPDEAHPLLHAALLTFRRLGAQPYARQTEQELAAIGSRPGGTRHPVQQLTPQELQVASAIADGMSNPEAAAALFISRKTVEAHLSSVYRKLGLQSRTQLVRYLTDGQFPSRPSHPG